MHHPYPGPVPSAEGRGLINPSSFSLSHSLVIDTLREVDQGRKCYRMVGGVLVERTVKEVLPALENNKDQVSPGDGRGGEGYTRLSLFVQS